MVFKKQAVINSGNATLPNIRSRKIVGSATPVEILAINENRKSLGFVNRASQDAYISIADPTSSETPPTGVSIADYAFIAPAKSQGVCGLGCPTGTISVHYDCAADAEFVATEGW